MTVAVTIRNVPEDIRDALAAEAKERGQSLQAFLHGVLVQQAGFHRNRALIAEVEREMESIDGWAGADAPDPAEAVRQARREAGRE